MAPGGFLGLAIMAGICVAGVVAQQYWTYGDEDVSESYPSVESHSSEYPSGLARSSEETVLVDQDGFLVSPYRSPGYEYWIERGRDGWGGGKKKKKKKGKKKKGKKGGGDEGWGGWGPVGISTSGVKVGWKGWIPPVKGWGWGWFGEKSGHYSFTDSGSGWGHRQKPHFPEPGPPIIVKHKPVHHKIHQQHGWGGWGW